MIHQMKMTNLKRVKVRNFLKQLGLEGLEEKILFNNKKSKTCKRKY